MSKTPAEPSTGEREPDCVIAMDEGAREPRLVSWNTFPVGTHWLYRAALAAQAPSPVAPSEPTAQQAIDALEAAKNGLEWYRDARPMLTDGSDDEMDAQIDAAVLALRAALPDAPVAPSEPTAQSHRPSPAWYAHMVNLEMEYEAEHGPIAWPSGAPRAAIPDEPVAWYDLNNFTTPPRWQAERPHGPYVWRPLYAAPIQPRQAEPVTMIRCDWCNNTGRAGRGGSPCYKCNGAGSLPLKEGEPRQAPSDALDAARYRYLRANSYVEIECDSPRTEGWNGNLDREVDRAILSTQGDRNG